MTMTALDALEQELRHLDARRGALEAEIRAFQLSGMNAPAFVNVPSEPCTDAQVEAMAAQEGVAA